MLDKIRKIKTEVAKKWGFTIADLEGPRRTRTLVFSRHEAMARIRKETPCSYSEIGFFFGRRNHATVIHACKRYKEDSGRYK